jgi:predicted amino acid racemase
MAVSAGRAVCRPAKSSERGSVSRAATIVIDLDAIERNARTLVERLPGIAITGVTKVACAEPEVAHALIRGGVAAIGDSRLRNLATLRRAGVTVPVWLIRAPQPAEALDAVRLADVSLNSEIETIAALDAACARLGEPHEVVLMVDVGDLREGVLPDDLPRLVEQVLALPHVKLAGIGVNLTCYGAIVPSVENIGQVVALAEEAEKVVGRKLLVSGGNSGSLPLALSGAMPAGVTNLRVGESILLGLNTLTREPLIPELALDAFTVRAPVIECLVKPSLPVGEVAQDAYGRRPSFIDRGLRRRAICQVGRQDVVPEGLTPLDPRVEVLGASSDHLVLDVEALDAPPALGDKISFRPSYACVLQAMTSPYVEKVFSRMPESVVARSTGEVDSERERA